MSRFAMNLLALLAYNLLDTARLKSNPIYEESFSVSPRRPFKAASTVEN